MCQGYNWSASPVPCGSNAWSHLRWTSEKFLSLSYADSFSIRWKDPGQVLREGFSGLAAQLKAVNVTLQNQQKLLLQHRDTQYRSAVTFKKIALYPSK